MRHLPLPVPGSDDEESEWENAFCFEFNHTISSTLPPLSDDDEINFWCVAYDDPDGQQIFRRDLVGDEMRELIAQSRSDSGTALVRIPSSFYAPRGRPPVKWIVWPHHREKGWCEKVEGTVVPA